MASRTPGSARTLAARPPVGKSRSVEPEGVRRQAGMTALLGVLLVPIVAAALQRTATTDLLADRDSPAGGKPASALLIDPNIASWWELTVLPGVGEVTAKRIVVYRRTRGRNSGRAEPGRAPAPVVFASPADLQQVKGIGPKSVLRMAPYLTFGHRLAAGQRR